MGISEVTTVAVCVVTALMALATWSMARATWKIAKANQTMIKAGETPKVVAFLDFNPMPIENWKFDIVLVNIGQGPARDVSFEFNPGDNDLSDAKTQPSIRLLATMGDTFFEWVPQGHKIVLGSIYHNPDNLPSPCKACVKYVDIHGQSKKDETYSLDLTNKKGIGVAKGWRRPLFKKMVNTLERIENHLSKKPT